jgi:hypothetical protein
VAALCLYSLTWSVALSILTWIFTLKWCLICFLCTGQSWCRLHLRGLLAWLSLPLKILQCFHARSFTKGNVAGFQETKIHVMPTPTKTSHQAYVKHSYHFYAENTDDSVVSHWNTLPYDLTYEVVGYLQWRTQKGHIFTGAMKNLETCPKPGNLHVPPGSAKGFPLFHDNAGAHIFPWNGFLLILLRHVTPVHLLWIWYSAWGTGACFGRV